MDEIDTAINYKIFAIKVYKDSIAYTYARGSEYTHSFSSGLPVRFKGNFTEFQNKLNIASKRWGAKDSVLVYEAVISKKGTMERIQLVLGESTDFSDLVKDKLKKAEWLPAFQSSTGSAMRVKTKIYLSIGKDGQLKIELPSRLYNFTGD